VRPWVVALVALAACSRPAKDNDEVAPVDSAHADERAHGGLPKRVRLPPNVIADAKIETTPVSMEVLATTLGLAGDIVADPDKSARVSSPVAGHLESVSVKEGSHVKKGDALAVLRVPDLGKVRGAYLATGAKARTARSNAERLKALLDQRLTSEQAYLDAKAEADSLDAESMALGDQLNAMGAGTGGGADFLLTLRAPLAGTVIARDAVVGQPVTTEQVLASIADLSEVWFLGRVFEKDLGRLAEGSPAEVTLNAYPTQHFEGTLERLGQQIDPVARTLTARVRLTNKDQLLRVGLFGVARIGLAQCEKREPGLIIPRTALSEIAGKQVVFVQEADGDYELHEVTVGDSALGRVQILTGLREGERVVSSGAFTLKSSVLKASLAEDE
jgi:cobalt-zinc-cadmium efflux system membrane fusion protein